MLQEASHKRVHPKGSPQNEGGRGAQHWAVGKGEKKMRRSESTCVRARNRGGEVAPPPIDVGAAAPRSPRGVAVKRHRRVAKGAATLGALVDGWDSILFAASLLVSRLFPWLLGGEKF